MACIRSIKPDFWTDEKIVELSFQARLLFIGLWNFADNSGRMYYSPKRIKMQIFPADKHDITPLLTELQREKLIAIYTSDWQEFLQIINFAKHQKVDPRYESKLPAPPGHTESHQSPPNPPLGNGDGDGDGVEHTAERRADPLAKLEVQGLDTKAWETWFKYRKATRRPLKPASILAAQRSLAAYGVDQAAVVQQSIAAGWQGLFALKNQPRTPDRKSIFAGGV